MRILFVCAGFQPGLDGVGDYVRLLAEALEALGHSTAVLAMNDKAIATLAEAQGPRPYLQLPSVMDWRTRERHARKFVAAFEPDWVSVQFVCYGFAYQGLPLRFPHQLQRIAGSHAGLHVMFHELTVGIGLGAPVKHRVLGALQRELVVRPLARLRRVKLIHTNIAPHAEVLARWGVNAEVLPLFGNIPVADVAQEAQTSWWLGRFGVARDSVYVAGFFGSITGDALSDAFMDSLLQRAHSKGRHLLIAAAGHLTEGGERYFDAKQIQYRGRAEFRRLGRLPVDEVSRFLSALHLGLASTPWHYVGKSGSVAAMLEHGLPVAVSRSDISIAGVSRNGLECEHQLARFGDPGFSQWLASAARGPVRERRAGIAARFAQSLADAAKAANFRGAVGGS